MRSAITRATIKEMDPLGIGHVRALKPVEFPSTDAEWDMPEGERHARLCEIIYQLLRAAAGDTASVGADQFVYFDAADPKRKCAPDAFLKRGPVRRNFPSWKTWEFGTPELCIEILSPSETQEVLSLEQKIERFRAMGVNEVLVYDADAQPGAALRAWDLVQGDLRERAVDGEATPCHTLGLWFVIAPCVEEAQARALRLAVDRDTRELVPTVQEARERERGEKQQALAQKDQEREDKERALARVAELEALLARR